MIDRSQQLSVLASIAGGAHTGNATINGTGIDTANADALTFAVVPTSWTDGTETFKLQDSPDNSVWTDVPQANLVGTFVVISSAPTAIVQKVGYLGIQRYVRPVATGAGQTTGSNFYVVAILSLGKKLPMA